MPVGKLTALTVTRTKTAGMYGDGGGLWLQVTGAGGKSWIFRYTLGGRARAMGLGAVSTFTLSDARDRAVACRKLIADGLDPIEARNSERTRQALDTAKSMTFAQCSEAFIEAHKAGWRDPRGPSLWRQRMRDYVDPVFGSLPVAAVDTSLVMKAIEPIWNTKTNTASVLRGRIENILDWATTRGFRTGENPARWKGHLANLLPKRAKVRRVEHHPALPFNEVPTFMQDLARQPGIAPQALALTILTAVRTGEAIGAEWSEIDLAAKIWTIPAARMKAGAEHRVPLSSPALRILRELHERRSGPFVFPGGRRAKALNKTAMLKVVVRMKRENLTVHGFRSSFRDWAAERTSFSKEVAEAALAHTLESKVEAAYRRSDLFEKRRRLMDAWAAYIEKGEMRAGERVVAIGR